MTSEQKIIYTETDEAPRLATYSLLPIIEAFAEAAGIVVETRDISLAGRILAKFPEYLEPDQRIADHLSELGALTQDPSANIIKLPNISASTPQMQSAIAELQQQGYALPNYPEDPREAAEQEIKARYDSVKGSAVNPVLREGNSDRRATRAVKEYAQKHPHRMGSWSSDSQSHVAHMSHGDFYGSEISTTMSGPDVLTIEFVADDGASTTLASALHVDAGEVVDAAYMSKAALCAFFDEQIAATAPGVLFSLHLKATMMKVSDPIIFGYAVQAYYRSALEKHAETLSGLGVDLNNGIGDVYDKIQTLPADEAAQIEADLDACLEAGPDLAMVNSDLGITNLHVPSDVIVDASMPAAIRESGKMWGPDGDLHDTKAVIPDRCYATVYTETINECIANGAFDPTTMGSTSNIGLMAQKAEEYGSHDTTFEAPGSGEMRVVGSTGEVLLRHEVASGDIWRMCRVKDESIRDWVKLAVSRGRITGDEVIFWLDQDRAHDAQLIAKVKTYLAEHDIQGLEIKILKPAEATRHSLQLMRQGKDTISVTGNVLRDYLTDLFPILELGTSAKMLSIVPLINGGGLFETGAGGSAPKHVQQMEAEGHLRWDSLGEFLALGASFEHLGRVFDNDAAKLLGETLDEAIAEFLDSNKSPSRKVNEIDNRGSHFFLAKFWAQAMARRADEDALKSRFERFAERLVEAETVITAELLDAQGHPVDLGGYYAPDPAKAAQVMRPSATLNDILAAL
ncbi:MAG TPA: NADP-dependent isocitrate dehydrogenase [Gammaproteobacteria bacterium]|nr:MAG: NADP-dependent isocitrate dehydrogenase [OM182 bacterium]HAL41724.1 NADP-dependent isocitrate dehydrogenase [Gammaproteobacteria bacterium]|tara:strand:+ start:8150 stop:10372 length:2223 start_codon:yes stop_codon:yes gene_type:complete